MTVGRYHFPLLFLVPDDGLSDVDCGAFGVSRRRWETSLFDLATLATKHKLHLAYELMEVMLARCNLEVWASAGTVDEAAEYLGALLLTLYIEGVSPTVAPFATSHSINAYSGINSRDSDYLRERLPEGMRDGFTTADGILEAWPIYPSLACQVLPDALKLTEQQFRRAAERAPLWLSLETKNVALRAVREAARAAPLLPSRDQSLLHVWCAIEGLFPRVSTEVSFRVALYLVQLTGDADRRERFRRARSAYDMRSKVAHGSLRSITREQWLEAWRLMLDSANAILDRGELPSEDALLDDILQSPCNFERSDVNDRGHG